MICLDGIPSPPDHSGWWDPTLLTQYLVSALGQFRHLALEMRDTGGTREDWEYLAEVTKNVALRAWKEIEKGG